MLKPLKIAKLLVTKLSVNMKKINRKNLLEILYLQLI